jgi:outer membrane protein OmpA-like peptidoglycan-associated protein
MYKLLIPLFFNTLLFADCSTNQKQQATLFWKQSQTMHGIEKVENLKKALGTCPLKKIKVDYYLTLIEKQLNQKTLSLALLNHLNRDIFDVRAINSSLFIAYLRNKNENKISILTQKIAQLEEKIQNNQEKLNQLHAYQKNSGTKRAFGSGERIQLPILFANGKANIQSNGNIRKLIKRIKATLKEDKNAHFFITGYASSRGKASLNQRLSEQRAINTKSYIERYIPKGHIETDGEGESDLICNSEGYPEFIGAGEYLCKNGTENEASSRRIEVLRRR